MQPALPLWRGHAAVAVHARGCTVGIRRVLLLDREGARVCWSVAVDSKCVRKDGAAGVLCS